MTTDDRGALASNVPAEALMVKLRAEQAQVLPNRWWENVVGRSPLQPENLGWYWGALGERVVARRLARLDGAWTVLHSLPIGDKDTDVDHLVVGPGGVFTINTKNHSGKRVYVRGRTFKVARRSERHVDKGVAEAGRVANLLSRAAGFPVPVTSLIVVVGAETLVVRAPDGVTVLADDALVRWLRKRTPVLAREQVDEIAALAAEPSSWTSRATADTDRKDLVAWFDALDRDVRSAQRVRDLHWPVCGALTVVAGSIYVLPLLLDGLSAGLLP